MLSNENRIEEALNDTLMNKAPFDILPLLSQMYGLEWVQSENITDQAQRAFLQKTLYGARGTYSSFFSSVRALFSSGESTLSLTLTRSVNFAYLKGQDLSNQWAIDRFIEIELADGSKKLTRSTHSESVNGEFRVYLSPISTASNTTLRGGVGTPEDQIVNATLLPFRLLEPQPTRRGHASSVEKPCTVMLELFSEVLSIVPPSYYRQNGDARTTDPEGMHMMSLSASPPFANGQNTPSPLYYDVNEELSGFIQSLLDKLLSAGVRIIARRVAYD